MASFRWGHPRREGRKMWYYKTFSIFDQYLHGYISETIEDEHLYCEDALFICTLAGQKNTDFILLGGVAQARDAQS